MRNREDRSPISPPPGLWRRIAQARLSLGWEYVWPAIWPALGIAGTFAALALLDFFAALAGWLHSVVLAAFAVCFGYALTRIRCLSCRRISKPCAVSKSELNIGYWKRFRHAAAGQDDPTTRACGTLIANRWRNESGY